MFTGLIDHVGTIDAVMSTPKGRRIHVCSNFEHITLGESIAVDGICLTVTDIDHGNFSADVSLQTCRLTTAAIWAVGSRVNLEKPLTMQHPVGGHFVSGHVDETVVIDDMTAEGDCFAMTLAGAKQPHLLTPQGSIALNGVSLTITELFADKCKVVLIPHTLASTNLMSLQPGQLLNIEYDMLAKMVAKQVAHQMGSHTDAT